MSYERIPADLREAGKFCLWRYVEREGKQTKVPYSPGGGMASTNKPHTFADFKRAEMVLKRRPGKYSGLGVGLFGDLVGIDVDHCVEDGVLSTLAKDIVDLIGSYTELSPSGTGVHILCRAPGLAFDKGKYYTKNPHNGVEVYVARYTNRFLTLTGDAINGEGLNERAVEVAELLERCMKRDARQGPTIKNPVEYEAAALLDDTELMSRMLNSTNGTQIARLLAGE